MVTLEDETGWNPCIHDIVKNECVLMAILTQVPHFIPALGFIALAIQLADTILNGRILRNDKEIEAFKYCFSIQCFCFSFNKLYRNFPHATFP